MLLLAQFSHELLSSLVMGMLRVPGMVLGHWWDLKLTNECGLAAVCSHCMASSGQPVTMGSGQTMASPWDTLA